MRTALLVAALTVAGCGVQADNCDHPARAFVIDEAFDQDEIDRLLLANHVLDRSQLECEIVCETLYVDEHPLGGATGVSTCELEFDGDFDGQPGAVLGTLHCEGRGIPQFCTDA